MIQKAKFAPYVKIVKDFGELPEVKTFRQKNGPKAYGYLYIIMMYLSKKYNFIASYDQLQEIADAINDGYKGPDAVTATQVYNIVADDTLFFHEGKKFQSRYLTQAMTVSTVIGLKASEEELKNPNRVINEFSQQNSSSLSSSFSSSFNNNINNNINNNNPTSTTTTEQQIRILEKGKKQAQEKDLFAKIDEQINGNFAQDNNNTNPSVFGVVDVVVDEDERVINSDSQSNTNEADLLSDREWAELETSKIFDNEDWLQAMENNPTLKLRLKSDKLVRRVVREWIVDRLIATGEHSNKSLNIRKFFINTTNPKLQLRKEIDERISIARTKQKEEEKKKLYQLAAEICHKYHISRYEAITVDFRRKETGYCNATIIPVNAPARPDGVMRWSHRYMKWIPFKDYNVLEECRAYMKLKDTPLYDYDLRKELTIKRLFEKYGSPEELLSRREMSAEKTGTARVGINNPAPRANHVYLPLNETLGE